MGLFKKKENKTSKQDFKIVLWDDAGFSPVEIKTFYASRFVDEDKVPFIFSETEKFMELYPQDIRDNVKLDSKSIEIKINEIEKKLEKIRNKDIEDYSEDEPNTKDLEFQLNKYLAKRRALQFDPKASYVSFDSTGQRTFNFLRRGNTFYPLKWDTDTNYIHTAAEPVVKKAGILLRNKETKYMPKKIIETSTLILLVLVIIGTIANLFFSGWLWKKWDSSSLAELEREKLELANICSELVIENARTVREIYIEVNKKINGTTTNTISGIQPN
jgi:hypothetical protein